MERYEIVMSDFTLDGDNRVSDDQDEDGKYQEMNRDRSLCRGSSGRPKRSVDTKVKVDSSVSKL